MCRKKGSQEIQKEREYRKEKIRVERKGVKKFRKERNHSVERKRVKKGKKKKRQYV